MRAAYGSPRPHRHHGNNLNDSVGVSSSAPAGFKMLMPPFLRLDSTGEDDGPVQSVNHQKTNTYRQGAPPSVTNTFWGKMFQFAPPPKTLLQNHTVPQAVAQGGISALDELIHSRQALDCVAKAGMRSNVKMAQTAQQQPPSRYGQWGVMHPNCPWLLPPGVFPCHVFRAAQSKSPVRPPTSGHFVHKGAWSPSGCSGTNTSSIAVTCEQFSVQKNATAYFQCAKTSPDCYIVQNTSNVQGGFSCPTVNAHSHTQGHSNAATSLPGCGKFNELHQTRSHTESKENTNMGEITPLEKDSRGAEQKSAECAASPSNTCNYSQSENSGAGNRNTQDKNQGLVTLNSLCSPGSHSILTVSQEEMVAKHPTKHETVNSEASDNKDDSNSEKETKGENNILGACSREVLQDMKTSPAGGQELESEDDDFWSDSEDEDAREIDEDCIEEALLDLPFCGLSETIILSRPEEVKGKRCSPKPDRAANTRWNRHYSTTVPPGRPSKVQFCCGKEIDEVRLFEQEEGELLDQEEGGLTTMEMQKARDLLQQHEGKAAQLLRKKRRSSQVSSAMQPNNNASGSASLQVRGIVTDGGDVCDGDASLLGHSEAAARARGAVAPGQHHEEDDDFVFDLDGVDFVLDDLETDDDGLESDEEGECVEVEEEEDDDEFVFFCKEDGEEK